MSNIEHDEDIVDLGAASVETQGAIRGVLDRKRSKSPTFS